MNYRLSAGILRTLFLIALTCFCLRFDARLVQANTSKSTPTPSPARNSETVTEKKDVAAANVVVSGNPSILRVPDNWWSYLPGSKIESDICSDFFIRARGSDIQDLQITSTGLGQAMFFLGGSNAVGSVASQSKALSVSIPRIGGSEREVHFCIPASLVQQPGSSAEGKIVILEGLDKSLEIPLKVEYPPVPPVLTAVQWFFGIAIPAVLSFLAAWGLTEVNTWRLERAREEKRFGKFKLRNYVSLQDFFTARYKNLPATNEEFAAKLRNELLTRRIWEYFPTRKQVALENAIRNYQRAEIGRVLAILFPDWQANIQVAPDRGSRPSMRQRVSGLVRDLKLTARNFLGSQQT